MNENKWIDNPRITIVEYVGANSKREKIIKPWLQKQQES